MSRGGYQGGRGGGGFRGQSNFEGGRGGGGGYRGQSNYGPKAPPTFTTTQIPQTTPSPFGQCKDVEIALRKGNQNLLINSYDVQLPKRNVNKYELKFVACSGPNGEREKELDVMSKQCVLENQRRICLTQLYFFLFEQQPLFIEAGKKKSDGRFEHLCAYDRGRIFYCTKDLGLKDKAQIFDIDITALTPEIFGRLRMPKRVYAAVKQTGFLNPQETLDGLSVATYMDIVFCQPQLDMNDRFIKSGPKVFDINTRQDIGNGCELKNGHQKGVRLVKDGANGQLQIDAKISPFYTKWSLLEYIHSKWGLGANDDLLSADINAELQQLKGIYVRTTHKTINDVFRIRSVSTVGSNQINFNVNDAGTNVADYFRTRYNRDLNFPHFPCVIKGPSDKQEFFPWKF
uniref:PAZ domain-containing protein n=1 Tax=Panagrolaimus superbus TaxID=310955 RepID=A0A914YLY0_9BILA